MKKIIICTHGYSDDIYKVGSHHYASQLTKLGYDVLVISMPVSLLHFAKLISKQSRFRMWKKISSSFKGVRTTKYGYKELVPFSLLPFMKNGPLHKNKVIDMQKHVIFFLKQKLKNHQFLNPDCIIVENPIFNFMRDVVDCDNFNYRATDIYPEFDNTSTSISEEELVKTASSVIVTSSSLKVHLERYLKEPKEIYLIENGVEADFFQNSTLVDKKFSKLYKTLDQPKKHVIYIGALDFRFDFELVNKCFNSCSDSYFHFIGTCSSTEKINSINSHENAFWWGAVDYSLLPCILKKCHIGLLPFVRSAINDARSPMKLYEYGISGLYVFATETTDLLVKDEPFVYLFNSSDDFCKGINNFDIAHADRQIPIKQSAKQSWKAKTNRLLDIITHESQALS